jgi:hypothetical protein
MSVTVLSDTYPSDYQTKYSNVYSSNPLTIYRLPLANNPIYWPGLRVNATRSTRLDYSIVEAVTLPIKVLSLVSAGAVACNA